ncbi:hypothetical protein IAT38_005250 [Cryptococcus sp. DSM 104549]
MASAYPPGGPIAPVPFGKLDKRLTSLLNPIRRRQRVSIITQLPPRLANPPPHGKSPHRTYIPPSRTITTPQHRKPSTTIPKTPSSINKPLPLLPGTLPTSALPIRSSSLTHTPADSYRYSTPDTSSTYSPYVTPSKPALQHSRVLTLFSRNPPQPRGASHSTETRHLLPKHSLELLLPQASPSISTKASRKARARSTASELAKLTKPRALPMRMPTRPAPSPPVTLAGGRMEARLSWDVDMDRRRSLYERVPSTEWELVKWDGSMEDGITSEAEEAVVLGRAEEGQGEWSEEEGAEHEDRMEDEAWAAIRDAERWDWPMPPKRAV